MKIVIRTKNFAVDTDIREYIEKKFASLEKFVQSCHTSDQWEKIKPSCELFIDIERTTKHHQKGLVFRALSEIRLPRKKMATEVFARGVIGAINELKEETVNEIKKYKEKSTEINRKTLRELKEKSRENI